MHSAGGSQWLPPFGEGPSHFVGRRDRQLSSSEGYPPPHAGRHSTLAVPGDWECDMGFIQHQIEGIHLDTTALHHDFQGHVQDFQQFQQETVGELAATHALAKENDRR